MLWLLHILLLLMETNAVDIRLDHPKFPSEHVMRPSIFLSGRTRYASAPGPKHSNVNCAIVGSRNRLDQYHEVVRILLVELKYASRYSYPRRPNVNHNHKQKSRYRL